MSVIYIGDASDVVKRVLMHCSSNVEGSALRKHVAVALGMSIARTRRDSGTVKTRIDSDDPARDEATIRRYIRGGTWRVVLCDSYDEANAFQWFAIEQLAPYLNVDRRPQEVWRCRPGCVRAQAPLFAQAISGHHPVARDKAGRSEDPVSAKSPPRRSHYRQHRRHRLRVSRLTELTRLTTLRCFVRD